MEVTVRLFAAARDAVGVDETRVALPEDATTSSLLDELVRRHPALAPLRRSLAVAVNEQYARGDTPLAPGDEVAVIPPISGGSSFLTRDPIDLDALVRQVHTHSDGAVVTFQGTVRDMAEGRRVVSMEYHAYESMAERELARIRDEMAERWGLEHVTLVHRLGHLELGEVSVAIVVASPHRAEAFEACRHAIDRIKALVPIWKKEHFAEGDAEWVTGQLPEGVSG